MVGSFDLSNPLAQEWISRHVGDLITQVTDDTRNSVKGVISKAFEQGLHPRQSAKLIKEVVGLTVKQAGAVANYRGRLAVKGLTEEIVEKRAARYATKLLKYRSEMIARTECLPGDTLVDGAVVRAVFRRWYDGDLIEIETSNGRKFSATANHPMFTNRGWLGAASISVGDYLVCYAGDKSFGSSSYKDVECYPTVISEVFDAVKIVGVFERRCGTNDDFHGDGRQSYIDVAVPDRELQIGKFSPLFKPLIYDVLTPSDFSRTAFCNQCGRLLSVNKQSCLCDSSFSYLPISQTSCNSVIGNLKSFSDFTTRRARKIFHANFRYRKILSEVCRLAASSIEQLSCVRPAASYSCCGNYITNPSNISSDLFCDKSVTESRSIELDNVVSVRLRSFSGHVFNLSTPYGYFTINRGLYTGNTITSSNHGQLMLWNQAAEKGLLDPRTTRRIWIATSGACPYCAALDGKTVGFTEQFSSEREAADGTPKDPVIVMAPALHPHCRCTSSLVFV